MLYFAPSRFLDKTTLFANQWVLMMAPQDQSKRKVQMSTIPRRHKPCWRSWCSCYPVLFYERNYARGPPPSCLRSRPPLPVLAPPSATSAGVISSCRKDELNTSTHNCSTCWFAGNSPLWLVVAEYISHLLHPLCFFCQNSQTHSILLQIMGWSC